MLVVSIEYFVENSFNLFYKLNEVIRQLPLVLVDVGNSLVLDEADVVLDLGHQATT